MLSQGQGAVGGVFIGAGKLAWYPDPYRFDVKNTIKSKALDLKYIFRNMTAPVLWGTLACGVYGGVECVMEGMRDEAHDKTYVNSAVAGAATGLVIGSMTRRYDIMATTALCVGGLMGMVEYNGQKTAGDKPHAEVKWNGLLPEFDKESDSLKALKEKYPEFKGL